MDEIDFLMNLKLKGELTTDELYPEGLPTTYDSVSECNCCLQVELIAKGLAKGTNKGITLTEMGEQFLDFINKRYGEVERE